jgi:hypothetical protein
VTAPEVDAGARRQRLCARSTAGHAFDDGEQGVCTRCGLTVHPEQPYASGFLWPPMTRWDLNSVEFERQTVIMDALPHAATVGKTDNWRAAADEFLRALTQAGWRVAPADSAHSAGGSDD